MLKHYITLAFRNMRRNKNAFFLNLLSLTLGLTGFLFILLWVQDEWQMDRFHSKNDRLFQAMYNWDYGDRMSTSTFTHGPLAESLKAEVPEVEHATTIIHWFDQFNLVVGESSYSEKGYYVGADFFQVFDFSLIEGTPDNALKQIEAIAISESLAMNWFGGTAKALGEVVQLEGQENLVIGGVFADPPAQSTLQFDFVMTYRKFLENPRNASRDTWDSTGPHTILTLQEGADKAQTAEKINQVIASKFDEPLEFNTFLRPYADGYLFSKYENGVQAGGRIEYVRLFSIIGIFLLLIACINFMNLATAMASKRMKEIGVKKTFGVKKKGLVFQYLMESTLLASLAVGLAMTMVWILLPSFNGLAEKSIILDPAWQGIAFLAGLAVLVGVLAGAYPAFYLSSFKTLNILKGERVTGKGTIGIRRFLVVFQFGVAIILIAGLIVVYQQIQFVQSKQLGYDKNNLIQFILNIDNRAQINTFVAEAKKLPGVSNVSSGNIPINHRNRTTAVTWEGKAQEQNDYFYFYASYYGLPETMGMELETGRTFSNEYGSERQKVILNEKAVEVIGFDDPLGKIVTLWDEVQLEVIGVVKDFHFQSFHEPIQPLIFRFMEQASPQLIAKLEKGKEQEALAGLQGLYQQFNPGIAFEFDFIDQQYNQQYKAEQKIATLSTIFAAFAILIAALGLFGLALFLAERRQKEIGIRKVLGASIASVVALLSKDFLQLVFIAILVASPIAWYFLQGWLDNFAYSIHLQWWIFAFAGLIAISIAFLTVSFQSVKAALANPVESLRNE